MTVTNVAICLVTVATNLVPCKAWVCADPSGLLISRNDCATFSCNGSYQTVYRNAVTTNYQYLCGFSHDTFDRYPEGDLPSVIKGCHWVKYCTCPCHPGAVVHHLEHQIMSMGRSQLERVRDLVDRALGDLQDGVTYRMLKRDLDE